MIYFIYTTEQAEEIRKQGVELVRVGRCANKEKNIYSLND